MSIAVHFDINDQATPEIKRFASKFSRDVLDARIGDACVDLMQQNYAALPSNKSGFPTTQFWQGAAESTSWNSTDTGVTMVTTQIGARLQYLGGDIKPGKGSSDVTGQPTKYLTIAATAESYGHQASEFEGLKFIKFGRASDAPAALVRVTDKPLKGHFKMGRHIGPTRDNRVALDVLYWLVTSATVPANPAVLPTSDQFFGVIERAVTGRRN